MRVESERKRRQDEVSEETGGSKESFKRVKGSSLALGAHEGLSKEETSELRSRGYR